MKDYVQTQLLASLRSITYAIHLIRAAPVQWFIIWLILNAYLFAGFFFLIAATTLQWQIFIAIAYAAHAIDGDPDWLYQNRVLDEFIISLNPNIRFTNYLFGFMMIIFAIAWGGLVHQLCNTCNTETGLLPTFLTHPVWQLVYAYGLILCTWFTPMYLIYHGNNIIRAIFFSLVSCLKNGLSWLILMGFFLLLAKGIVRISASSPFWIVPSVATWFMLFGISSYTHFRALYPHLEANVATQMR